MLGNSQVLASAIAAIVSVLACAAVAQPTVVWDGKPVLQIIGESGDQQPGGVLQRGDGSTATSCQENPNNSANANIIIQKRARWLLSRTDELFLLSEPSGP